MQDILGLCQLLHALHPHSWSGSKIAFKLTMLNQLNADKPARHKIFMVAHWSSAGFDANLQWKVATGRKKMCHVAAIACLRGLNLLLVAGSCD